MKPRSISSSQFEAFLQRLSADREDAGRQYEQLRRRLISLFTYRGCREPEELADETLDRTATKIQGLDPRLDAADASRFVFGIAWNVARESFHQRRLHALPDDLELVDPTPSLDSRLTTDVLSHCLDVCLERLTSSDRSLVLQYFQSDKTAKIEQRSALARQMQISPNALRLRVSRITSSLRVCASGCVKGSAVVQGTWGATRR